MATKRTTKKKNYDKRLSADAELERLRDLLNKKREFVAILEVELFNTRADLAKWQYMYDQRLGDLELRLRELRFKLFQTMEAQRESLGEDPNEFDLNDEDAFNYQEKIDPEEHSVNGNGNKKLDPKLEEKIRKLFRELAKRFHPDLTADEDEKRWREEIMATINQAYTARDLHALELLAEQPDRDIDIKKQTREEEIKAIRFEMKRLDTVIHELKSTIKWLEDSPAMKIKLQVRVGRNIDEILEEKEIELQAPIMGLEQHLEQHDLSSNGTAPSSD